VEDKMLKKKILVVVFLLSITIFAGNAFALVPAGTDLTFKDIETSITNPWTQIIDNSSFTPNLDDNEPLIIEKARLILSLNFIPDFVGGKKPYVFMAYVTLDGLPMSTKIIKYSFESDSSFTKKWKALITNPDALNAIADKSALIKITPIIGTLSSVNSSKLIGRASVAPEPISMVLFGVGIVGLPVAGRFRRFIKKG
jgi:hypothetical protein